MVWVEVTLAVLLLFVALGYAIRVTLYLEFLSPRQFEISGMLSVLWLKHPFHIVPQTALHESGPSFTQDISTSNTSENSSGQAGYVRIPSFTSSSKLPNPASRFKATKKHLKKKSRMAVRKFLLDTTVWKMLLHFLWKSGKGVFGLLHLRLELLRIGLEDVSLLGKFAAIWSVWTGLFPALNGPVSYGFNQNFNLQIKMKSQFNLLDVLGLCVISLISFPWWQLLRRFGVAWRNPKLNLWQRRLLLF